MGILLTIMHVLVCFFLVLAVLLQSGKGGGLASAIGGGLSASSVLGGRSAVTFLSKATAVLAAIFMLSSLSQALLAGEPSEVPATATERMLHGREMPVQPVPFDTEGQGGLLPSSGQENAGGEAQGGQGQQGAAP